MRAIIAANKPLRREVVGRDDLIARWQQQGESFKAEWAAALPEGEELTSIGRVTTGRICAAGRICPRPASSTRPRSS